MVLSLLPKKLVKKYAGNFYGLDQTHEIKLMLLGKIVYSLKDCGGFRL